MKKLLALFLLAAAPALATIPPFAQGVGGTGSSSFSNHGVIYESGNAFLSLTGSTDQCVVLQTSADPIAAPCAIPGTNIAVSGRTISLTGQVPEANGGFAADVHAQVGYPKNAGGAFSFITLFPIGDGGTNASSQTSGGVNYFDGTKITSGAGLQWDGSNILNVSTATPEHRWTVSGNYFRDFRSSSSNAQTRSNHAQWAPPNSDIDTHTATFTKTSYAQGPSGGSNYDSTAFSAMTIIAWIKQRGINHAISGEQYVVNRGHSVNIISLVSDLGDGNCHVPQFIAKSGGNYAYGTTPGGTCSVANPLGSGINMLAGTWDNTATKLYVNASLQTGATANSGSGASSNPDNDAWLVGDAAANSALNFDGQIDEIRIYTRVLSSGEISTCYSTPASCTSSGILHVWHFDETTGTAAYDSAGVYGGTAQTLTLAGNTIPTWDTPGLVAVQQPTVLDTVQIACQDATVENHSDQCELGNSPGDSLTANTTLSGNGGSITSGATSMKVASSSPFPTSIPFYVWVDSEAIQVVGVGGTTWTIARGQINTSAASHNDGAAVALLQAPHWKLNAGVVQAKLDSYGLDLQNAPVETEFTNDTATGTAQFLLAKVSGANVIVTSGGETNGVLGVCAYGCGISGSARIVVSGWTQCAFDGATTAGHYVQQSSTSGLCHDAGASLPSGQVVGQVFQTNGGAGTYWFFQYSAGGSGSMNALLDGAVHTDTNAHTVARGDMIVGKGSSAKWDGLSFGSTVNLYPKSGGSGADPLMSSLPAAGTGDPGGGNCKFIAVNNGDAAPTWGTLSAGSNVTITCSGYNASIASTGGGGGGSLAITDGVTNVASPTTEKFIGATVASASGGTEADVTVGGSTESHTASSSATLDFTTCISSTYDEYRIEFVNVRPASNAVNIRLRFGTGGTPTWDTGSDYSWAAFRASKAGSAAAGSATDTSMGLDGSGTLVNTSTDGGLVGTLRLAGPANGSYHPRVRWESSTNDGTGNPDIAVMGTGSYLSTTAITAFQIYASTGNLASGTVRCYGIPK